MSDPGAPAAGSTRRGLLAGAIGTGAGLLLAGCGATAKSIDVHPTVPTAAPRGGAASADVPLLAAALELERRTVAAYAAAIPNLPAAQAAWAQTFLGEELEHTGELISLIKLAGGTPAAPAGSYAIGHPRGATATLVSLASLEALQLTFYAASIPRLSAGAVRAGAASILADDAQHITALRAAAGRAPLSGPLLGGAVGPSVTTTVAGPV